MRLRKRPNLAARTEKCGHLLAVQPEQLRGRWLETHMFKELHIELGCGKGRFTLETAKSEPDVFFVALEKSANALVIALERISNEDLQNIRLMNAFAENLTAFFAPGEVSRIYINFCDPWPANRHSKRRLTAQRFLELYKGLLRQGGEIHFKTDNRPLFEFSLREFELCGFELYGITNDLHKDGVVGVMTDYELKFHEQGLPIYRCIAGAGEAGCK